jgi:hypothetical protein
VRTFFVSAFILLISQLHAQKDYFYAATLLENGQYTEAVRVLDHLIDSGAYADRPRFAMMTLNLAGSAKQYLKDTVGAKECFQAVMTCYDTLSKPMKSDDWNKREYFSAGRSLAGMHYHAGDYTTANNLLHKIGYPGRYYSSTGSDVEQAQDSYCSFRARTFQKLNRPDSAFNWILKLRDRENPIVKPLDSIFNVKTNVIYHISCTSFSDENYDSLQNYTGTVYCVGWKDKNGHPYSVWLKHVIGRSEILGMGSVSSDSDFPLCPDSMSLSPDEKFLAIEGSAEGANWIDILLFQPLIKEKNCTRYCSIQPYPGLVYIVGWENESLIVKSDADLTKLNKKNRLSMPDVFGTIDDKQLFLFDPESGKYSKK